jgi:hypothetical protein
MVQRDLSHHPTVSFQNKFQSTYFSDVTSSQHSLKSKQSMTQLKERVEAEDKWENSFQSLEAFPLSHVVHK